MNAKLVGNAVIAVVKLTERVSKGLLSITKNIAVVGLLRGIHVPVIKSKASWKIDIVRAYERWIALGPVSLHQSNYS